MPKLLDERLNSMNKKRVKFTSTLLIQSIETIMKDSPEEFTVFL